MFITTVDKRILRSAINTQIDLGKYVIIDPDNQVCYQSRGWYSSDIDKAADSSIRKRLPFSPAVISCSIDNLIANGLLERQHSNVVYQVTYLGWYHASVRRSEQFSLLLNNVFFPALVAVGSSIITTLLLRL